MPPTRTPKYRRQVKPDGRDLAFVVLHGRRHYLGRYDTPRSRQRYHAMLAEWEASAGQLPPQPGGEQLTVSQILATFWRHAQQHYVNDHGGPSSELDNFRQAMRPLRELYGVLPARDFGPRKLRAVRQSWVGRQLARSHINKQTSRIRMIFKWAASHELVPVDVYQALSTVAGLRRGRTKATEPGPIRPVPEEHIEAVQPFVSRQVWALIQLQIRTGARPGELLSMRPVEIDTTGDIWVYRPGQHKSAHMGRERVIDLGPKAQEIIEEFLVGRPVDAYLFTPAEAEAERHNEGNHRRSLDTPTVDGGDTRPSHSKTSRFRSRYSVGSYRRAIQRACDHAFAPPPALARKRVHARGRKKKSMRWETIEEWRARIGEAAWRKLLQWQKDYRWHPHQLRHNAATSFREHYGLDIAQTVLGHRVGSTITEIYAATNLERARDAVRMLG